LRAAAVATVQKKIQQMRSRDEDDSSDDDDEEDEIEEEDSSSDSDAVGKRRGRGRSSPRSRPPPVIKSRANVRSNARSARGKNLAPPKREPIQMLKRNCVLRDLMR